MNIDAASPRSSSNASKPHQVVAAQITSPFSSEVGAHRSVRSITGEDSPYSFSLVTLQSSSFGFTPAEREGAWTVGGWLVRPNNVRASKTMRARWVVGSSNAHNTMPHRGLARVRNQAFKGPRRIHNRGRQMGSTSFLFPPCLFAHRRWSRADSLNSP